MSAVAAPPRKAITVAPKDWLELPSGSLVQVCKIVGVLHPEVSLRYVDEMGVMAHGEFRMKLDLLKRVAVKVGRA